MDIQNPAQTVRPGAAGVMDRRDFLNGIATAALLAAAAGAAVVTLEYLSPNVLFEPPTSFRIGVPENYAVNSVTYFPEQQVYIVRAPAGFSAFSAICTHLGCITQWKPEADMIACPCHGSKFQPDGKVIAGPAPRPLPHYSINLAADGELLVNKLEIIKPDQVLNV